MTERKETDAEFNRRLVGEAITRLITWVKAEDTEIPPQVSFDIGVLIGRLNMLEKRGLEI